jgi:hypothetical protein
MEDYSQRKKDGGRLGIEFVLTKNKTLLFKRIWKLGCNDKAREKYKPSFSNGVSQFSKRISVI